MILIEDIGCCLTFECSEKICVFEYSESLKMMLRESYSAIYKYKYPSARHCSLAIHLWLPFNDDNLVSFDWKFTYGLGSFQTFFRKNETMIVLLVEVIASTAWFQGGL